MPDNPELSATNYSPIQTVWLDFVVSARPLFDPQIDNRSLDQYLQFRDAVFALIQSPSFLAGLNEGWSKWEETWAEYSQLPEKWRHTTREISTALILELKAFPLAMSVAKATDLANTEPKGVIASIKKHIGWFSTTAGSLADLVESLPPYVKGGITLLKELADLFKGRE